MIADETGVSEKTLRRGRPRRRDEILTELGVRAPDHRPRKGESDSPLPKTTGAAAWRD